MLDIPVHYTESETIEPRSTRMDGSL